MPLKINPDQVGLNARGDGLFALPFEEQIQFFQGKKGLLLPTEHWDDITGAAHDRAFMVAGAMKADLLADFYGAVEKAIAEGKSLDWFRKNFAQIVQKHGWDYTGAFDWRSRVIYQANLQASYAAGRYAQLTHPDLLQNRPWWKYLHNDSVAHPRPPHVRWSGLTLRYDNPWWQAHYPPGGFGCRCRVTAVAEPTPGRDAAPDDGSYEYVDRNGDTHQVPVGIDYGWGYTPGQAWVGKLLMDKAAVLPAKIGAQAVQAAYRGTELLDEVANHYAQWAAGIDRNRPKGERFVVGALKPELVDFLNAKGMPPETAGITLGDSEYAHFHRDAKAGQLPGAETARLPDRLDKPLAVLWDAQGLAQGKAPALAYVFKVSGTEYAKVVVELGYKAKDRVAGKRARINTNAITTAGVVGWDNVKEQAAWELAGGEWP